MPQGIDNFKEFVKEHPLLKDEVREKRRSWQSIYEEWVLYDDEENWNRYKKIKEEDTKKPVKEEEKVTSSDDMIKNIMGYVKKINPDSITKTIGSVQKLIELISSFGAGGAVGSVASTKKKTGDPLFDRRFDDWY